MERIRSFFGGGVGVCGCVCVCVGGVCVCGVRLPCLYFRGLSYENTTTHRGLYTFRGPKTGPRKTLAKNAENVMFYHLRGVRAPRTSMDFQPYLIYEDIRVLGSISKASRGVCVCVCVCVFLVSFLFSVWLFISLFLFLIQVKTLRHIGRQIWGLVSVLEKSKYGIEFQAMQHMVCFST